MFIGAELRAIDRVLYLRKRMRGIRPIKLVADGLNSVSLPLLSRPHVLPTQARTEELAQWGTKLYAYSVIAHIHKILGGLMLLADAENVPAAMIVSRHIFEWTAQACYMSSKLRDCYQAKDWEEAWAILTPAAIGNMWAKKYGDKYAPSSQQPLPTVPDPLRIGIAVSMYEKYQLQAHGWEEAKDTYGLLSEFSHPNAACLQQYQDFRSDGTVAIGYIEAHGASSPLPFVNWCLIHFMLFLDTLLQLAADTTARADIRRILMNLQSWLPTKLRSHSGAPRNRVAPATTVPCQR